MLVSAAQQNEEVQANLRRTAALLEQSRQLAEDAQYIYGEVTEAIAQAEHTLALTRKRLHPGSSGPVARPGRTNASPAAD
ncbi:MAG TPA: hypothetical protein VF646_11865 [Cytophagales bacterium]